MAPLTAYDGLKVFSATKFEQRARLGDAITAWCAAQEGRVLVGTVVRQSSDTSFHCLSVVVFWREAHG